MIRKTHRVTAAALALLAASATPAAARPNIPFLRQAIRGDTSEMALGQLAMARGGSAAVSGFGAMLVGDHAADRDDALFIADKVGLREPLQMTPEGRAELVRLQGLTGSAFDREFARYMVADHSKTVAAYAAEAARPTSGSNWVARRHLPALRQHLAMARALAGR